MPATDALQAETADVLSRLIQFRTVNPPGAERECQEWLRAYLEGAGLACELAGEDPERPNLVARLAAAEGADGPVLGYLSHVDTVLADPDDWSRDPWSGEVADGCLWGRGAQDMKSQTAAEVVAVATLARQGWRPARGELRVFSVVDEEVGGAMGAQWLTRERRDLARCDWLLNEGGGPVMPFGDRRLYGVCCAEKGTFRFAVRARGKAGHASVPGLADNALLKLAPVLGRLADWRGPYEVGEEPRVLLEALGADPDDPAAAVAQVRAAEPRLAVLVEPTLCVTAVPTLVSASEKINVVPARAELKVDCRVPPGMRGEAVMERIRGLAGDDHDVEIAFTEGVVGNRSPIDSPLMHAIRDWVESRDPGAEVVPTVLPAFTDSRWWRDAFPDCVAYGFCPQRRMNAYETWPLVHGADERIAVEDLGFAADMFAALPRKLLGEGT
jgi:acetylornithine deacetylase/succinyl-diaminopimelate desuccinylase-like protein